jgi:hypothetical protein
VSHTLEEERRRRREEFEREVDEAIRKAEEAFRGQYAEEISALLGLSREEIDAISPGQADMEAYAKLIAVVREASRINVAQAALATQIRQLGSFAVSIANKVPQLAAIL